MRWAATRRRQALARRTRCEIGYAAIAGHETTVDPIGNELFALLTHLDQFALLHENPDLVHAAVEETCAGIPRSIRPARLTPPRPLNIQV